MGVLLPFVDLSAKWPGLLNGLARGADITPSAASHLLEIAQFLVCACLLIVIARYWEDERWRSIGIGTFSGRNILLAVLLPLVATRLDIVISRFVIAAPPRDPASHRGQWLVQFFREPHGWDVASTAADALIEELGSRAYLIERVTALTGRLWIGAGASLAVSVAMHVPLLGVSGSLAATPTLGLLVCLYAWRRSLPACTMAHLLFDLRVLILLLPSSPLTHFLFVPALYLLAWLPF